MARVPENPVKYTNIWRKSTIIKIKNPKNDYNKQKAMEELKSYIKIKENGCWEWIGGWDTCTDGIDQIPSVIFDNVVGCPQEFLYPDLIDNCCNICKEYEWCGHEERIWWESGVNCGYYNCLNIDHIFVFKSNDLFKDSDNGMPLEDLSKKYGKPIDTLESWIKTNKEECKEDLEDLLDKND